MLQHASSSIAAIAGALAKAQVELTNPEKSLTGTISGGEQRGDRFFRYAPLSSGLEIVRKSLGRHEIATLQTTSIDETGLIRLTTVLAHSSGEWISSDFPVCPVAETSAAHRLGTALTYARRYALFTLVGIAGEDDTDGLDLAGREDHPDGDQAIQRISGGNRLERSAATARSRRARTPSPTLSRDESARLGEQLKNELAGTGSPDELLAWALRILPMKNSLGAEDAANVERAFQARMHELVPGPEPSLSDPSSSETLNGDGSGTVNVALAFAKTPRRRDKRHLKFVCSQPCLICGRAPSDAHHLRFAQPRALGTKVSDEFTVPLCRAHHRALHNSGDERAWWNVLGVDPSPVAHQLWTETR